MYGEKPGALTMLSMCATAVKFLTSRPSLILLFISIVFYVMGYLNECEVEVYAQLDNTQSLRFLNFSNHVTFPKVLSAFQNPLRSRRDIRVRNGLYERYVFILQGMCNHGKTLQVTLINTWKAVQYVENLNDKSVWNQLIDRTLTDTKGSMPELTDAVKGHPFADDLNTHDLKNKIIKTFDKNSREKSLTADTTNILRSNCMKLAGRYKFKSTKEVNIILFIQFIIFHYQYILHFMHNKKQEQINYKHKNKSCDNHHMVNNRVVYFKEQNLVHQKCNHYDSAHALDDLNHDCEVVERGLHRLKHTYYYMNMTM